MRAQIVLIGILAVWALGLVTPTPGTAQVNIGIHIGTPPPPPPPIVIAAPPQLVVIPGLPVSYAPSVPYNYFVYKGRYYTVHEGAWFVGSAYHGPWTHIAVERVPSYVRRVPVTYYKIPPGHLKDKEHHPGEGRGHGHGHGHGKGHKHKKHKDD